MTHHQYNWRICNKEIPKSEIIYFTQVLLIYIVVLACVINLSFRDCDQPLWSSLLSGSLGYLLPAPAIKRKSIRNQDIDLVDSSTKNVPLLRPPTL